jgi:phytoene synthase
MTDIELRPAAPIAAAYAACDRITRAEAKNFYYGIRLLPPAKRAALCAVYALARRIDDIGDGTLPRADKAAALEHVRAAVARLDDAGDPSDPVLHAVSDAAQRFPVPLGAFGELIDGVRMDVDGRGYATFDELTEYCRCVAGAVGRLCLSIFGSDPDPRAAGYADELGIALQQTNILRDVREDLGNGRIYLPQQDLDAHGVRLELDAAGRLRDPDGGLAELLRFASARAEDWYARGLRLLPHLDRRSAACCAAMAGIYRRLGVRIRADPTAVYDRRLSLSGWEKARVAATALVGVDW